MRSSRNRTPSSLPNAFDSTFLKLFEKRDEPPTGPEADVAGPWHVELTADPRFPFGLFRAGESVARGFRPTAVFADRWLALLAAAMLPGTGRDAFLRFDKAAGEHGYGVLLDDGSPAGRFELFDDALLGALNHAVALVRSPWSLANLLEAAGPLALQRSGAILEQSVSEGEEGL